MDNFSVCCVQESYGQSLLLLLRAPGHQADEGTPELSPHLGGGCAARQRALAVPYALVHICVIRTHPRAGQVTISRKDAVDCQSNGAGEAGHDRRSVAIIVQSSRVARAAATLGRSWIHINSQLRVAGNGVDRFQRGAGQQLHADVNLVDILPHCTPRLVPEHEAI